ncbi:MAG TPA: hypothetical protein VFZ52_06555 [Chryseolinea sp.]
MGSRIVVLICVMFLCGCSFSDDDPGISVFSVSFDFNESEDGWRADFTDLPSSSDDSAFYELKYAYTNLPANLASKKAIMLSGNNHGDDLFMFMKRKISGLAPNTYYTLVFEVEFASNAPQGSLDVGGSPGESVYLKAGASEIEPVKNVEGDKYVLNIDKGNQSTPGANAIVLGNIAIPSTVAEYTIITRNNASPSSQPFIAKSNGSGDIWLLIGTDSGFEGTTTLYYTKVNVLFSASN